nr:MAG TPA: hypothetical protein [Caudoviricetes sp.]
MEVAKRIILASLMTIILMIIFLISIKHIMFHQLDVFTAMIGVILNVIVISLATLFAIHKTK